MNWPILESKLLKNNAFIGTGAWFDVDLICKINKPLVYTVIINPMGAYKFENIKLFEDIYEMASWQG